MSESLLLVERDGPVVLVTMNRPKAMNSLSKTLQRELAQTLARLDGDSSVRAIVLTGNGDRAFTAGLDLKEVGSTGIQSSAAGAFGEDLMKTLDGMSKPIVGAVNGVAITGGFEVALACDVLVGSTNARFADTHARVGVIPFWGLSQRLSRRIGISRAKEMSFTGNFIDSDTALAWGLLNSVVAPAELVPFAKKMAHDMASDPGMVQRYKRLIDSGYERSFGEAMVLEKDVAMKEIVKVTAESVEGKRRAVLERNRGQKL
ncbi:short chain enoyl-CoA hydratase [Gonapodya prolifera JEL478]|uniref:Short chain enoyl-CoA hydratase n=1 Tax=Gonapodya prolifera (strain JEL478) TaxID=1344416 RepID=A0A139AP52_GONPJ|nr:short chain enoyl-CoA hydratase [Gonapodya prolifera JEL478]|eukprot:KXS18283.1 short chain enoyl-CoA hydratase [Gonapodya prolifera JEL478]